MLGNIKELTQPNEIKIYYEYDSFGFLQKRWSSDSTIHEIYKYDSNNLLRKVTEFFGETALDYDENQNLKEERLSNGLILKYEYDLLGRIVKIIYPDSSSANYVYKGSNLKKIVRQNTQDQPLYEHGYSYDLSGNIVKTKLAGNCGEIEYTYNVLNQPTRIVAPFWEETLTSYDPVGNLRERTIQDMRGLTTCQYDYDDLYQLKTEQGIADHDYIHDSLYNAVHKDDAVQEFNDVNQLLNDGKVIYEYDKNGNLKFDQTNTYDYDALNRLTKVQTQDGCIDYTYDTLNRRMTKKTVDEEIRYFYAGQNEIGSVDSQGNLLELRVLGRGKGAEIGAAVALEISGQVFVPIHDHQGNCVVILDKDTGEAVEGYRFSAFGLEQLFDGKGDVLEV